MPRPYGAGPGRMPPNYASNGQAGGSPSNPPSHRHPYPHSNHNPNARNSDYYSSDSFVNASKESISAALQSTLGIPSSSRNPNPHPCPPSRSRPLSNTNHSPPAEHSYPNSRSSEQNVQREGFPRENCSYANNTRMTPTERPQQYSTTYSQRNYYEQSSTNTNENPESNRVLKQSAYEDGGEDFAQKYGGQGRTPKTRQNNYGYSDRVQTTRQPSERSYVNPIRPNNSSRVHEVKRIEQLDRNIVTEHRIVPLQPIMAPGTPAPPTIAFNDDFFRKFRGLECSTCFEHVAFQKRSEPVPRALYCSLKCLSVGMTNEGEYRTETTNAPAHVNHIAVRQPAEPKPITRGGDEVRAQAPAQVDSIDARQPAERKPTTRGGDEFRTKAPAQVNGIAARQPAEAKPTTRGGDEVRTQAPAQVNRIAARQPAEPKPTTKDGDEVRPNAPAQVNRIAAQHQQPAEPKPTTRSGEEIRTKTNAPAQVNCTARQPAEPKPTTKDGDEFRARPTPAVVKSNPFTDKITAPTPLLPKTRPSAPIPARKKYMLKDLPLTEAIQPNGAVKVAFVWNMTKYFVVADDDASTALNVQTIIANVIAGCATLEKNEVPEVGEVLLGDYGDHDYYRAVVQEVHKISKTCRVEFLDFGDTATNTFGMLRIPTEQLMELPIYGLTVNMVLTEKSPPEEITKEAPVQFKKLLLKPLQIEFVDKFEREGMVRLWHTEHDTLNDIVDTMFNHYHDTGSLL